MSRLSGLAVDDRGGGARFASGRLANRDIERLVDALQRAVRIPTKPAMDSNRKPATCSDLKPASVPI